MQSHRRTRECYTSNINVRWNTFVGSLASQFLHFSAPVNFTVESQSTPNNGTCAPIAALLLLGPTRACVVLNFRELGSFALLSTWCDAVKSSQLWLRRQLSLSYQIDLGQRKNSRWSCLTRACHNMSWHR